MFRYWKLGIFTAGALAMFAALPAQATIDLDFGTGGAGPGGVITIVGGDIAGAGVPINSLTVTGGTLMDGLFNVSGAVVCTTLIPGDISCGSLDFDTGIASNFITITGGVAGLGIADGTVLMTGTISSFVLAQSSLNQATGPDVKDPGLLVVLGIGGLNFNFFGFSLSTGGGCAPGVALCAISTDILNSIPEPTTLGLFGIGLLALGFMSRRRKRLVA